MSTPPWSPKNSTLEVVDLVDYATGYRDGFAAGMAAAGNMPMMSTPGAMMMAPADEKPKRKVSKYSRAYGRAYKELRRKATLKSGALRKGVTHKRLVKQAHALARKRTK